MNYASHKLLSYMVISSVAVTKLTKAGYNSTALNETRIIQQNTSLKLTINQTLTAAITTHNTAVHLVNATTNQVSIESDNSSLNGTVDFTNAVIANKSTNHMMKQSPNRTDQVAVPSIATITLSPKVQRAPLAFNITGITSDLSTNQTVNKRVPTVKKIIPSPTKAPGGRPSKVTKPRIKESRPLRSPSWPLNRVRVDLNEMKSEKRFESEGKTSKVEVFTPKEMEMEDEFMMDYRGTFTWGVMMYTAGTVVLGCFVVRLVWRMYRQHQRGNEYGDYRPYDDDDDSEMMALILSDSPTL